VYCVWQVVKTPKIIFKNPVYTCFCHVHTHVLKFFTFLIDKYFGINIPSSGEYLSRFLRQKSLIKNGEMWWWWWTPCAVDLCGYYHWHYVRLSIQRCNLLPDISKLLARTIFEYLDPVDPMFLFLFIILCVHLCLFLLFQTFVVVDFF